MLKKDSKNDRENDEANGEKKEQDAPAAVASDEEDEELTIYSRKGLDMTIDRQFDPFYDLRRRIPTSIIEIDLYGVPVKLKLEGENPSCSHKDRVAQAKVSFWRRLNQFGRTPSIFILSTSGNTGYAFATYLADIRDARLLIVADVLSPACQIERLKKFPNVEVEVVDQPDATGSHLAARLRHIDNLRKTYPDAIIIDQYGDPLFPLAYEFSLADEIERQVDGPIAAVFLAAGTCGAILGVDYCKRYRARRYDVVPVDAEGSRLFFDYNPGMRLFSGYGNARSTAFAQECSVISSPVIVDNLSVARMARWLLIRHELLVGASSAAVAAAFAQVLRFPDYGGIAHSGEVVLVMPDGGENYRDTLHNDDWLIEHGLGKAISGP